MKFHVYLFSGWYVQHSQLQNPKKVMAGFKHAKPGHFNGRKWTKIAMEHPHVEENLFLVDRWFTPRFFPRVYTSQVVGSWKTQDERNMLDFILLITLKIHSLKGLIPKKKSRSTTLWRAILEALKSHGNLGVVTPIFSGLSTFIFPWVFGAQRWYLTIQEICNRPNLSI